MQLLTLKNRIDYLHKRFGDQDFDPIYGAGCIENPKLMLVFMNPTARNVSASKKWKGIKAPWIGTKNVWNLFSKCNLISKEMSSCIQGMTPSEWTEDFAYRLYQDLNIHKIYLTNLAKCTQTDARKLPNSLFKEYLPLFYKEILLIEPMSIITLGNQVSSILVNKRINISKDRGKNFTLRIQNSAFRIIPTFYPVGQGMRNMDKAIKDIKRTIGTG